MFQGKNKAHLAINKCVMLKTVFISQFTVSTYQFYFWTYTWDYDKNS